LPEGEFLKAIARAFHGRHLDRLAKELGIASRRVRIRAHTLAGIVTTSTENARRRLPEEWQDSEVIDGIVDVVRGMARVFWDAAAERG
jgi:hypothetical protein